ncbi:hypothetical protein AYK24_00290 [Thermoplasmatales archaeon SG8-52-4]|nr:MAG: hypothetical protein AYK24_00290 [Thermoplasmatales archaeon SG8-52-4]
MAGFTNRGKLRVLEMVFRQEYAGGSLPTNLYIALCTVDNVPDADTNTLADLTQIATGNGYTDGGYQLSFGATDFDVQNEVDASDYSYIQIKDVVWTASGGELPSSGNGARYAVLTDDNGTVANREVLTYWDLTSARSVSDGQSLTLQNCELRLTET